MYTENIFRQKTSMVAIIKYPRLPVTFVSILQGDPQKKHYLRNSNISDPPKGKCVVDELGMLSGSCSSTHGGASEIEAPNCAVASHEVACSPLIALFQLSKFE